MYSFTSLKVCFVGIGSIATKHIKNLQEICKENEINLTIDALRRSESKALDETSLGVHNIYTSLRELPEDYDVIFITNPTKLHISTLYQMHDKGRHFFIEKPVTSVEKVEESVSFIPKHNSIYYVACPMRYKRVTQYIKENVDVKKVIGVRSFCSSYLPEWRPGTDYRKCYSAIKALGGGVSIDLIHEWDYLVYLFGFPQKIQCAFSQKSKLEIDCEDYAAYIAEYPDKMIELHLDYFGRASLREIMLFTVEDTIVGDFIENQIRYLKSGKVVKLSETQNENKKRELTHFLDIIDGKTENDNDMQMAYKVLNLTQGVIKDW